MSNIMPKTPSYVFGYWRPWKENSNFFDSYLEYAKDTSLAKYGADTVGKYINQASKMQVQAINQLGQAIGRGMNVLSNQMSDINETLVFLNRNMDVQVEQQKLSNLLLQNIAELLRVPDSEKERQHSIELGIKFFVNASKDPDLFEDALENLLKAESMMKQDYFVLHRIGCVYLYVEKYINPELALDYFLRSAKYACVESDPKASRLVNVLSNNLISNDIKSTASPSEPNPKLFNLIIERGEINLSLWITISAFVMDQLNAQSDPENNNQILLEGKNQVYIDDIGESLNLLKSQGIKIQIIETNNKSNNLTSIDLIDESQKTSIDISLLAADSYEKAAFAAYILSRFSDAVNYQSKALKFNDIPQNRFLLAKYQVRNGEISEGVKNLSQCIDDEPVFALASFKEIDLINESEVLNLISNKNQEIDNEISKLLYKWKEVESIKASKVINELNELLQKSYEIKVSEYKLFEKQAIEINKNIGATENLIDSYISEINNASFCTIDANGIHAIIAELSKAKDLPLEKMQEVFNGVKKQLDSDKLKIGVKSFGGVVFYIDIYNGFGLVCTEVIGKAIWGINGQFGTSEKFDTGDINTKKIADLASTKEEKSFFKTTKIPLETAAKICINCKIEDYEDWYLPSIEELQIAYNSVKKYGVLGEKNLWSSTESDYFATGVGNLYSSDAIIGYCYALSLDPTNGEIRTTYVDNYRKEENDFVAIRKFLIPKK
jgi:hypothetical protein